MTHRGQYTPGPVRGAEVRKGPPETVWQALTGPSHPCGRAPDGVNGSLRAVGTVKLTTAGAPAMHAFLERLEYHLDGPAPGDVSKRVAGVRRLHG